jgi:hypothetical protein
MLCCNKEPTRMARDKKKVVLIGLEPQFVDFANLTMKLDEPTLRAGLAADEKRLRDLGYDASWLLIDRGETAEAVVTAALQDHRLRPDRRGHPHDPAAVSVVREADQRGARERATSQALLQHAARRHGGVRPALGLAARLRYR